MPAKIFCPGLTVDVLYTYPLWYDPTEVRRNAGFIKDSGLRVVTNFISHYSKKRTFKAD